MPETCTQASRPTTPEHQYHQHQDQHQPLTVRAHTATACPPISPTSGTHANAGAPPRSAGTPTWHEDTAIQKKTHSCHGQQTKKLEKTIFLPPTSSHNTPRPKRYSKVARNRWDAAQGSKHRSRAAAYPVHLWGRKAKPLQPNVKITGNKSPQLPPPRPPSENAPPHSALLAQNTLRPTGAVKQTARDG